eukprot:CAMPEP_0119085412 /NCGR_PEP_ID=MMETSP1178-20130426/133700_1 /TAXON_ID=33656 /ORGANISM="unid sp, Strain CCMP2000" /LENGTH=71 /DNA_ID=CAMNT_0007068467 /DNA_START=29 /DNA_END=241 /DNA_ORIENTATION=+
MAMSMGSAPGEMPNGLQMQVPPHHMMFGADAPPHAPPPHFMSVGGGMATMAQPMQGMQEMPPMQGMVPSMG